MSQTLETRRAGERERASGLILGRDNPEDALTALELQAAFLASRFAMGDALARVVAEHAFAKGTAR